MSDPFSQLIEESDRSEYKFVLDDHSRLLVGSDTLNRFKAADVLDSFVAAGQAYGLPESLLTDNGAVFTANSRRGKVVLESALERLGVQGDGTLLRELTLDPDRVYQPLGGP